MLTKFGRGQVCSLLLIAAAPVAAQVADPHPTAVAHWPGRRADGSVLLPNQWSLRPAGRQVPLGDFPVNIAVHPGSRYAAVLHCGYGRQEIVVVEVPSARVASRTRIPEAFYGLEFSPDGRTIYCSGAGNEVIHTFAFHDGRLSDEHPIQLRDPKARGIPAGMALTPDGHHLYVANLWGQDVTKIDLAAGPRVQDIRIGAAGVGPGARGVVPPSEFDLAAASKRREALAETTGADAPFPYACRVDARRQRLYVSLWAQAAVAVVDLKSNRVLAHWPTQEHPNEMLLTKSGRRLYVANGNRNTVTVLDTDSGQSIETLSASLYPSAPPGSTPNSLALARDEKTLFVANADNNNVAVFDVSTPGRGQSLGFIPVGWYPTSVRVTPNGKFLLVANGKGITSKANPHHEYIGGLMRGTLSVIPLPKGKALQDELRRDTALAYHCSPLKSDLTVSAARPEDSPIPLQPGDPSPIKYCIYVIKENRTYDQVLGDLREGNGDPHLCLFPERVTPNHHRLASQFVLLDNFYVDAEVSADGHEWSMGAYATDFVEKSWPLSYGHDKHGKYPYPSEGNFHVAMPANGYLWDRARQAGVSYRNYGEFINNGKTLRDPSSTRVVALQNHFDPWFHGWDLDYPDVKRAERFLEEMKRFEATGDMPRLQIVRLPNDHTYGTAAGKPTPTAMVAENDVGLGRLVDGVSHSKFWPHTAIFVLEDDAQDGPDHVDAHRSIAFVISPYVRRRAVDSTMYSTSSLLRTIELILGLQPMSQYDAAAAPMYNAFQSQPDLEPYHAVAANVDLHERNRRTAWGSDLSRTMDFSREDAVDDRWLNEVIWHSVRGSTDPMPGPTRAAFVFAHARGDDDD
ncbi:MAG: beta-propeller fold lactonase family protein [Verrucomicrobia bacterium]|nr:beta-propeller fold lactonase family protein [Verrucomicrobiota bacterium]